ncbi:3-isopropylmalate dehydratase large subunit [Pseudorhodoplanes sp.]|uniref:3-isopropylmalate dehydratase large subunit n=1 Tax=Pseudorhodoplanes sp. TaxID=1934341 RepID=UPI003D099ED0
MTLSEKIVARAAGRSFVSPGEIVTCAVDLAMIHDSGGPRRVEPILRRLGSGVWDPAKVVLITDHYVPATDDESRRIQEITRQFAADQRIVNFYDRQGICHVVLPERGHLRPGMFVVGGDSHSPTGGAFAAYMFGVGATEMAGVLATGEIWLRVPETIRIEWTGRIGRGVSAKDMMLHLCARLGMDGGRYQAVEYTGEGVRALPMQERMTLSNMAAELGAQAGLIEADETTAACLGAAGVAAEQISQWRSDTGSKVSEHHVFDASALAPQVAAPHSPANAAPVVEHAGTKIDVAYIGACTGAKLADLRMAAEVLRGRKAAKHVDLVCAPASLRDQEIARGEGTLAAILDAGARLLPNACGICAGYGDDRLGENIVAMSSTARNFKGRMGAASSKVYLGSPYTTAASAIEGQIADPRPYLQAGRA